MIESQIDFQDLWTSTRDHYQNLWVLYAVVAFGFAGFAFSETYRATSKIAKKILTLVFLLFATTSVKASLDTAHLQREALRLLGWDSDPKLASLDGLMQPPPDWLILVIQGGAAAAVVVALWISTWQARKSSAKLGGKP